MKTIYHKADSRGFANHGWLKSYHSFSFANYFDPNRMSFGTLRVLNDDYVEGEMGFGMHPHRNMEIISIPLEGSLRHSDNMGNSGIIRKGDIQVMSAGTGIMHSEENAMEEPVKFLQIWIIPNQMDVSPRYDQINIDEKAIRNDFQQILSPSAEDEGVWIYQDAWFNMARFDKGIERSYSIHKTGNGVYVFVIKGSAKIGDQYLEERDGLGIWETEKFHITATADAEILLMEVPMYLPQ